MPTQCSAASTAAGFQHWRDTDTVNLRSLAYPARLLQLPPCRRPLQVLRRPWHSLEAPRDTCDGSGDLAAPAIGCCQLFARGCAGLLFYLEDSALKHAKKEEEEDGETVFELWQPFRPRTHIQGWLATRLRWYKGEKAQGPAGTGFVHGMHGPAS